jgi:hypothetical protein
VFSGFAEDADVAVAEDASSKAAIMVDHDIGVFGPP